MFATPGLRVGAYEILESAGTGGMGEVYRARDTRLGRLVAIKFVAGEHRQNETAAARLEREARLASSLNHPGIVTVFDVGVHDNHPYVVMELIDGVPLSQQVAAGPLGIREAIDLSAQIAEALAAAHDAGIMHRDLKPQNVMLTLGGRAKIVDFGLSRVFAIQQTEATISGDALTGALAVLGTPGYMSPEQVRGLPAGPQSDQFALGAILYELLTNTRAFRKDSSVETLSSILVDEPRPIGELRQGVPPEVVAVVSRCLEKRSADRYASTADLARDLRDALSVLVVETRSLPQGKPRRPQPARGRLIAAAAAVAIVAIGAWSWNRLPAPAPPAPVLPAVRHIVVLPFTNVTNDPADQVFADGLVETLTSSLSGLERLQSKLRVVPASEVRGGRIATVKDARQAFGATLAITGSIQHLPSAARLTLNLVDATTVSQLASRTIDIGAGREAVTQDVVIGVATALLSLELEPDARKALSAGGTQVAKAYELYLQGRGFLQRLDRVENVDRAIDALSKAVAADPTYALAHTALGEAYWRKFEIDKKTEWIEKAVAHCARALGIDSRVAAVHVTLATIAIGRGRYEEAVAVAERAVELDPVASEGYRALGRAYELMKRTDDAEATYRRAVAARPDDWLAANALAVFHLGRSRLDEAEAGFRRVIELTPDNTRGYNNLGVVLFRRDRVPDAVATWERSMQIRPTFTAASNLGTHYFGEGRYGDSARAVERAVEQAPNDRRVWRNLGAALYYAPGERAKAAAAFEKALQLAEAEHAINPRQPSVVAEIADSASMLGRRETALDAIRAVERMDTSDASDHFMIATAYEQLGERTPALKWLEKALATGYDRRRVESSPSFAALRKDPRYADLVSKLTH